MISSVAPASTAGAAKRGSRKFSRILNESGYIITIITIIIGGGAIITTIIITIIGVITTTTTTTTITTITIPTDPSRIARKALTRIASAGRQFARRPVDAPISGVEDSVRR